MPELKIRISDKLESDLRLLQKQFGTQTMAETIRRAVAREVVLQRAVEENREVTIQGSRADGKKVHFVA